MLGYGGRVLHIHLPECKVDIEGINEDYARRYLGGNGFAVKILYDQGSSEIDAFDPRNVIVFAVGPITDTPIPGNSRVCVATKSPLTGLFFDSTFGGRFAITQKRTGFDAICLEGRAGKPIYIVVDEDGAYMRPAEDLWGRWTQDTASLIQAREGEDVDVVAIGPAGENLVRFACLAHYWKNREGFGGRGGVGAVMGSKNIKALAVRGNRRTEIANPASLKAQISETRETLNKGTMALSKYGTPVLVDMINYHGGLGTFNCQDEVWEKAEEINGERYRDRFFEKDTTCMKCPVACGKMSQVREGEYAGTRWKMPEYETLFALGSMNGNSNPASIIKANELCDQLGLDTISMGVTLALACECFEKGLLTDRDVGFPLRFSDHRVTVELIELTARGRALAASWLRARSGSQRGSGKGRESFSIVSRVWRFLDTLPEL